MNNRTALTIFPICFLILVLGTHFQKRPHRFYNKPSPILKGIEESTREYSRGVFNETVPCKICSDFIPERRREVFESAAQEYSFHLIAFIEARPPPAVS